MDIHFKDLIDTPATSCASYSRQIAFTCHNDPPESATVLSSSCASCWSSQVAAHFTSIHLIYVVFVLDRLHRCDPTGFELVSSMSALWNPTRPSDPLWHCLVLGVNLQNMAGMNWKTLHTGCLMLLRAKFSILVVRHSTFSWIQASWRFHIILSIDTCVRAAQFICSDCAFGEVCCHSVFPPSFWRTPGLHNTKFWYMWVYHTTNCQ